MDTDRWFRIWVAVLHVPPHAGMRFPVLTILAVTAVVVFASGGVAPKDAALPAKSSMLSKPMPDGTMPAGPLFAPLSPEEAGHDPVPVPEPVWASVLAACAVILLRRGRVY
jgi:hypothetical protein